jgi:hypothetical protein
MSSADQTAVVWDESEERKRLLWVGNQVRCENLYGYCVG